MTALWAEGEEADWWVNSTEDRDLADRGLARGDITPVQKPNNCAGTEHTKLHFLTEDIFQQKKCIGFDTILLFSYWGKGVVWHENDSCYISWRRPGTMCPCYPASHASVQHQVDSQTGILLQPRASNHSQSRSCKTAAVQGCMAWQDPSQSMRP